MATATGYTCDVCFTFEVAGKENKRPDWMILSVPNEHDIRDTKFDVCSDKCLLTLARERYNVNKPIKQQKERRVHTPEFKKEIVALVQGGSPLAEVARDFDLASSVVRNWVKKSEED